MTQPEPEVMERAPEWDLSILLDELPGLARRRLGIIVASLLASLALGVSYLTLTPPLYNVGARILVQHRDLPLQEETRAISTGKFLGTQAEIINSPAVIRSALESVPFADFEGSEDERLQDVLDSFSVTPVDRSHVLVLSHWTANPEEGIRVVGATIESYREFVRETGHTELEALQILTRKEKELRDELAVLQARYREFRAQSGLLGTDERAFNAPTAMLSRLADQIVEAKSRRLELESQLEAEKARRRASGNAAGSNGTPAAQPVVRDATAAATSIPSGGGPDRQTAVSADTRKIGEELWEAKVRVAALLQSYGDAHPHVREARQQVAMWESRLGESLNADLLALEQELRSARRSEGHLNDLYRRELASTKALDSQQLEERALLEEMERVRESHQSMLGTLKKWELTLEAVTRLQGGILVRTLEAPGLRVEKVWPSNVLVLGPCAFVGLAGGLLLAIVVDRSRLRSS